MSQIGSLPQVLERIPCTSEVEALRVLKDRKADGLCANYIRHSRQSFTVVVRACP
jgi:hypothetical protein